MSDSETIRFVLTCASQQCPMCNPGDEGAEIASEALAALDQLIAENERLREALWAIRGSDGWLGLDAIEMGVPTSNGRYKSAIARAILSEAGKR